jgi:arylsulfatase A-like enzyme
MTPRAPATRVRLGEVVTLAVAGAMLTALVHVAITEFHFRVLNTFTWTNREFSWLAPIGYLVCFVVAAIPVAGAALAVPRIVTRSVVASAFAALGLFSIGLLFQKIHPLATLVLALGAGTRAGWAVAGRWSASLARARWISLGALGILGVGGIAAGGARRLTERWHLSRIGDAPPEAPNVILLILDTVRAANLSVYGYERETTPTLTRLANEGVLFEHAFSTAPWTAPSHASMMTGRWAGQTRADYRTPLDPEAPTLAEVLSAHGYATAAFMANTGFAGYQVGLARGFARYEDFPLTFDQALWSTTLTQTNMGRKFLDGLNERSRWKMFAAARDFDLRIVGVFQGQRQSAAEIANHFFRWRSRVDRAPFFAMLNFMDAHAPYEPPDGFRTKFGDGTREIDRYDGGIAYEDSIVGSIVERLRTSGELDRTIFIVTSDHGEQWGEHGLESHGNSLFLPLLHVPLIVTGGSLPSGQRIAPLVSLRDLAATVLDLAGVARHDLPGRSLAPSWRAGSTEGLSPVVAEASPAINPAPRNLTARGPISALIDSTWHFIRYGDGAEELFDWRSDPAELTNQARTATGEPQAAAMREALARHLGASWPIAPPAPSPKD